MRGARDHFSGGLRPGSTSPQRAAGPRKNRVALRYNVEATLMAETYNKPMHRLLHSISVCLLVISARAEVQVLNLQQAVNRALQQNPDIALARLDEQKAANAVRAAKAPFTPSVYAGSGLAYSSGFPMSVDGQAASIVQARARQSIFNRQLSYSVAAARESARGAGIATSAKREEIAFRTASM